MPIFKKRHDNPVETLEREHAITSERRDRLREKLATAEVALDQALTARRKALLESDGEVGSSSQEIVGLGLDRDALLDALEQIEAKVAHLESRLKQERSRAEREMAASELDDHTRKLVAAIEALRNAAATVCEALPSVTSRVPHSNGNFAKDLRDLLLTNVIDVNLGDVLRLATAHREALLVGDAPIRAPDVAMPPAAPAPVIERVDVLLIANSCWPEGDQMVSGARWSLRPVPVGIVAHAEKLGWIFRRDSETVQRLLDTGQIMSGGPWHSPAISDCINLATVSRRSPRGSLGRSLGEPADEATPAAGVPNATVTIGATTIGTASAGPV